MNHRLMMIGVGLTACLSAAVAPASAQSVYGEGYAYGPTHGSLYWYAPHGYAYGHRPRRGYLVPIMGTYQEAARSISAMADGSLVIR